MKNRNVLRLFLKQRDVYRPRIKFIIKLSIYWISYIKYNFYSYTCSIVIGCLRSLGVTLTTYAIHHYVDVSWQPNSSRNIWLLSKAMIFDVWVPVLLVISITHSVSQSINQSFNQWINRYHSLHRRSSNASEKMNFNTTRYNVSHKSVHKEEGGMGESEVSQVMLQELHCRHIS